MKFQVRFYLKDFFKGFCYLKKKVWKWLRCLVKALLEMNELLQIICNFFNFLFYIGVQLINNVVLVLGVQQSVSVLHIHVSIIFQFLFSIRLLTEYWAEFLLLYSKSLLVIHFKYSVDVYKSIPSSLSLPTTHPRPVTISLFSKSVSLFLFCK